LGGGMQKSIFATSGKGFPKNTTKKQNPHNNTERVGLSMKNQGGKGS